MAANVIPKEQLTAYQRWELLGIEEPRQPEAVTQAEPEPEGVPLPTAEDIERIHQQAAQEGFRMGQEEGYQAGYKAGFDAGRQAAAELASQLGALVTALDNEQIRQDEAIARELLGLSLAVARQMIRSALQVKQGLVLEIIREAMNSLPSLTGHLRIMVHPDDVEALREFMEAEHSHFAYKVVADSRLERGGFRIESNHSEVDGQLPIRWREIVDCLGSDSEWLE